MTKKAKIEHKSQVCPAAERIIDSLSSGCWRARGRWELGHDRDSPGHLRHQTTKRPTANSSSSSSTSIPILQIRPHVACHVGGASGSCTLPDVGRGGCSAEKVSGVGLTCRAAFLGWPTMGAIAGGERDSRPQSYLCVASHSSYTFYDTAYTMWRSHSATFLGPSCNPHSVRH